MEVRNMVGALILVNTGAGHMHDVYERTRKLDGVERAEMLTGPYDIMVIARGEEITEITSTLIDRIRDISGVEGTITNIFIRPQRLYPELGSKK